MTTLDCTVDGLGGRWLPAQLTTDHSASSYGQPVILLEGKPHSPMDLIYALRPAAHASDRPRNFAVMVRIEGSGEPVYYYWRDRYSVTTTRLGDYDPDSPYQEAVQQSAAAVRDHARAYGSDFDGIPASDLADATAQMVIAIASARPPAPQPVDERQVAEAPEDYIAFRLTAEAWSLVAAAVRIGFLVVPIAYDALDVLEPAIWLRSGRATLGISQSDLGAALDVSSNTIARWERGELPPQHPRMLRLAMRALPDVLNRVIE